MRFLPPEGVALWTALSTYLCAPLKNHNNRLFVSRLLNSSWRRALVGTTPVRSSIVPLRGRSPAYPSSSWPPSPPVWIPSSVCACECCDCDRPAQHTTVDKSEEAFGIPLPLAASAGYSSCGHSRQVPCATEVQRRDSAHHSYGTPISISFFPGSYILALVLPCLRV
jgi:hypothetical protein